MKHIILLVFLLAVGISSASAQNFEGTLTWTNKSDIKLSDEQTQQMREAKKQFEAQMNNPEFKKQMEQNPAIKEMMEKQLKTMEGMESGGSFNFLPEKMVTKVKGKNTATMMNETNVILYRGDVSKTWSLDTKQKTYYEIDNSETDDVNPKIKVTKTGETATINGYKCTKYIIVVEDAANSGLSQWLWATTDIKDIDLALFRGSGNQNVNWFYKDVQGFPVKVEMKTPQGSITMELTELKRTKLPDSDFQIPPDYKKQ
jgi:hypothetical protein